MLGWLCACWCCGRMSLCVVVLWRDGFVRGGAVAKIK